MSSKTVGRFTFDDADGTISGPAEYMKAQGFARIARINEGALSEADRRIIAAAPDAVTGILVALQTDYAGWIGYKSYFGRAPR